LGIEVNGGDDAKAALLDLGFIKSKEVQGVLDCREDVSGLSTEAIDAVAFLDLGKGRPGEL
jgi:hypothetical protein